MALHVQWDDEELPKLQELLNRALNTWDSKNVPKWAWELEARVLARINDLKPKTQEKCDDIVNDGS